MQQSPYLAQTQSQRQMQILAPQLRQSLEFLQVPVMELRTLIRREVEQNPTLEEQVDDHEVLEVQEDQASPTDFDGELQFQEEYARLSRLDDEWRDYFMQSSPGRPYTAEDAARRQFMFDSLTQEETLQEHLLRQLGMVKVSEPGKRLAALLIGCINEDGYLNSTLGEIAETTNSSVEELEHLLALIQEMDPIGVGARDLKECLALQLERLGRAATSLEGRIIEHHLGDLAAGRYTEIADALQSPVTRVYEAARMISTLEPKPGRQYAGENTVFVVPEISVVRQGGDYVCRLNNERLPRIRISRYYRQMLETPDTPKETKDYIREKIRAGVFMIQSIHQRQKTILNIAREIVRVQREFLDHGVSHLRPLAMTDIARVLEVHETTVSRAVANKYMATPRGLFEMKYFFTPGLRTESGEDVSNKAVKDALEKLVSAEDSAHPLTDLEMTQELRKQGLKVARRTIAKYREQLHIPPSHQRRD